MRFSLLLDKRFKICVKELLKSDWLNVHDTYLQFIVSNIFKFHSDQCSDYFDELFFTVGKNSVNVFFQQKVKATFSKNKTKIQSLSHLGPNTWNSLPGNLKFVTSVSSFKHYIYHLFMYSQKRSPRDCVIQLRDNQIFKALL